MSGSYTVDFCLSFLISTVMPTGYLLNNLDMVMTDVDGIEEPILLCLIECKS